MIDEAVFSACGTSVLLAWLALIAAAAAPEGSAWACRLALLGGRIVPLILCAAYAGIFASLAAGDTAGSLFSLAGIRAKFASGDRLFLLYLEVLAFSLLIGGWILADARSRGLPRRLVMPLLAAQCLFGPIALIGYAAIRRIAVAPARGRR